MKQCGAFYDRRGITIPFPGAPAMAGKVADDPEASPLAATEADDSLLELVGASSDDELTDDEDGDASEDSGESCVFRPKNPGAATVMFCSGLAI